MVERWQAGDREVTRRALGGGAGETSPSTPTPAQLDDIFLALADPTRRAIVDRLATGGEASLSTLAAPFDISLPAVAKHVRILVRSGIVADQRRGRERRCRLVAEPLGAADEWLVRYRSFWQDQLGSLHRYMASRQRESP